MFLGLSGFAALGLGFRMRVSDSGFRIAGSGLGVQGYVFRALELGALRGA